MHRTPSEALQNAVFFRLGLGDEEKAVNDAKLFEKNYRRKYPLESSQVNFSLGSIDERQGDMQKVVNHYRASSRVQEDRAAARDYPGERERRAAYSTWRRRTMPPRPRTRPRPRRTSAPRSTVAGQQGPVRPLPCATISKECYPASRRSARLRPSSTWQVATSISSPDQIPRVQDQGERQGRGADKKKAMQDVFQKWMAEDFTKWLGEKAKALEIAQKSYEGLRS